VERAWTPSSPMQCQACGQSGAHADGFCSDRCLVEHERSRRLNRKLSEVKVGKKRHYHESGASRVERWLSRETHKMMAEFCILVTAGVMAEIFVRAVPHLLHMPVHTTGLFT